MPLAIPMYLVFKKHLVCIALCCTCCIALSQNAFEAPAHLYEFNIECPMYKCDISGKITDSTLLVAPPNAKFTLVEMLATQYIIRFTLLPNSRKVIAPLYSKDDFTTYTYFIITKAQLDFKASSIKRSNLNLLVGNIFTPIKLRFKPFDFAKDISVGTTFGAKYSFTEKQTTSVDALIAIGITSLRIDSAASLKKVDDAVDILSFTSSIGMVLEFGNAQLGVFLGLDLISNSNQQKYEWTYKNKPWISFGIGYSLFSFNVKQ